MDELEILRAQKRAALNAAHQAPQEYGNSQYEKQAELQQQIEMLEAVVKQYLAADAIARLGTLKLAHPEKALQAMVVLGQFIKAGKIRAPLSDEQFKDIIRMMTPDKKETTIKRV